MMRQLFALHDSDPQDKRGMFPVDEGDALILNKEGYGIFWEVNLHYPKGRRGLKFIDRYVSCYCEFDELSKSDQWKMINRYLAPSLVIESDRGYHVYWNLISQPTVSKYRNLQERIIHFYGADQAVKDPSRVLRAPSFDHMKDPSKPFPVEVKYRSDAIYTPDEIGHCFPPMPKKLEDRNEVPLAFKKSFGEDLTQRIDSLGNRYALERLSGTAAVNGEYFGFKHVGDGRHNILVNGKMTACWVDSKDRIGSHSGGGPTFAQFVNWYHKDWRKTFNLLKQNLPELFP